LLIGIGLVACTVTEVNEPAQQEESATIVATRLLPSPTAFSSSSPMPTKSATATVTPEPTMTAVPEITAAALETISTNQAATPILVATMQPDPYRRSFLPENVWWSEDSQVLYYQAIETQEAWAYDLSTGVSSPIAYVPRSLRELEPQLQATLPENASIVSLSPDHRYVLYRLPLAEPVPIPDNPSENPTPTPQFQLSNEYTAELWLHKEGQDFNLGLVDDCFALLFPPLWSENENVVIVNTRGTPEIACLHHVWLIDLETLSIGPLYLPFTEDYSVLDLSANGDAFLIRSFTDRLNYLYDSTTNAQWSIPVDDTDRMTLVEAGQSPHCLVFELEFSEEILRDHVWYCEPITGEITFLSTIEGEVSQGVVSPDQKFIAFVVDNDFLPGIVYEDITPGIWLLALP
jgi:hypothetical protein